MFETSPAEGGSKLTSKDEASAEAGTLDFKGFLLSSPVQLQG